MSTPQLQAAWNQDIAEVLARPLPWDRLSGTRVLVTGAGGFLGGYLVRTLLALHGAGRVDTPVQVVAMVRDIAAARTRYADLLQHPGFTLMAWDLNRLAVPEIGACHYVLHAASQASPRFYGSDPVGTALPNTVGTTALLQALQRSPVARGFLFVSSSEVYGSVPREATLDEARYGTVDPAQLRACYAESKRMGETLCVAWHHQHGLPTFIVRPFHTYGPGLLANDGRVFADFAFNVVRGENIVMTSDGSARRAFCYAADAVAGFFTVLLCGQPATAYNVANPAAELSVMELAELLVRLFPEKGLRVERHAPPAGTPYLASAYSRLVPDVGRLAVLGWRPLVDPHSGFRRMIEAHTS